MRPWPPSNPLPRARGRARHHSPPHLPPLATPSLGYNKIGSAGGAAIAEALKVNTTLKELDLSLNPLGGEAEQMVRAAVEGREGFELYT